MEASETSLSRMTIKVRPVTAIKTTPHLTPDTFEEFHHLQTSARRLYCQIEGFRERTRILGMLATEQEATQQGTISYKRLRELLTENR